MAKIVEVEQAHRQLAELIREAELGQQVVIARNGTPVAILMGNDEYDSLMATLEEVADPGSLRALRQAQADVTAGRLYKYEDVFGHLPRRVSRKRR